MSSRRQATLCIISTLLLICLSRDANSQANNFDWSYGAGWSGSAVVGGNTLSYRISSDFKSGEKKQLKWGTAAPNTDVFGSTFFWFVGATSGGSVNGYFNDEITGGNNGDDSWKEMGMDCNEGHAFGYDNYTMKVTANAECKAALRFVWKITSEVDLFANFKAAGNDVDKVEAQLKVSTWSECIGAEPLIQHEISVSESTTTVITHGVNFSATVGGSQKDGASGQLGGGYSFSEQRTPAKPFNITSSAGPKTLYCSYCIGAGEMRSFRNWTEVDAFKLVMKGENEPTGQRERQYADLGISDCRVKAELIRVEVYKDENGSVVSPGTTVVAECRNISEGTWKRIYKDLGLTDESSSRRADLRGGGDKLVSFGGSRTLNVDFDSAPFWDTPVEVRLTTVPEGVVSTPSHVMLAPGAESVSIQVSGVSHGGVVLQLEWTDPLNGHAGGMSEPFAIVNRAYDVVTRSLHSSYMNEPSVATVVGTPITVIVQTYRDLPEAPVVYLQTDSPDVEVRGPNIQAGGSGGVASFEVHSETVGRATLSLQFNDQLTQRSILFTERVLDLTLRTVEPMGAVFPEQEVFYVGMVTNTGSQPLTNISVRSETPDNGTFLAAGLSNVALVRDPETGVEHLEALIPLLSPGEQFTFRYNVLVSKASQLSPEHALLSCQFRASLLPPAATMQSETIVYYSGDGSGSAVPHTLPVSKPTLLSALEMVGGAFTLKLTGEPGRQVVVQASRDLNTWETLSTVTLGSEPLIYTDVTAANLAHRFYRAVHAQ